MADERILGQSRDLGQTELAALKAERMLIWSALKNETDEAESAVLMQRLKAYHAQIAELRDRGVTESGTYESDRLPESVPPFRRVPEVVAAPRPGPVSLGPGMPQTSVPVAVPVPGHQERRSVPMFYIAPVLAGLLAVAGGLLWLLTSNPLSSEPEGVAASEIVAGRMVTTSLGGTSNNAGPGESAAAGDSLGQIRLALAGLGLTDLNVERNGAIISISGSAPSEEIRDGAIRAASQLINDGESLDVSGIVLGPVVTSASDGRLAELQRELNRTVALTPLIFASGATNLTASQERILNVVATTLLEYPEAVVQVVGYTDSVGDPTSNRNVSLRRADNVLRFLVGLGVPEANLRSDARGEASASGSAGLASLERRVEFEVIGSAAAPAVVAEQGTLRVAIVTPSARDDLAFSQSMVDAMNVIGQERGGVEITINDNIFVPTEAADLIRDYATQGYDLVIGHSSTFGAEILKIAPEFPDVAFAYGTVTDNFGLPNVYAYGVNAAEGAYVNGAMSSMLSTTKVIGIVGPVRIPEAEQYEAGFNAGALSQTPGAQVLVAYTDSFSDVSLASEAAAAHIAAGADVLTGSSQMVVGAISVAEANNAAWFGNQADQSPFAPNTVAAAQVYRWEVLLREVVADVDSGNFNGRVLTANLANGGLSITYNDAYPLPPDIRQRGDELIAGIIAGTTAVPGP